MSSGQDYLVINFSVMVVKYENCLVLLQEDDGGSRAADDWNYRRSRSSYGGNGRGRWNDSIPNNIILMRGLPEEAVETDVRLFFF